MSIKCVIFDLDGTLVDSEGLCNQAFLDLLPSLDDTLDGMVSRYRGMKLSLILADLQKRTGHRLPINFEHVYRQRVSELFSSGLKPMAGVPQMLASLPLSKCVASSGPPAKIEAALRTTGLWQSFAGMTFSAYDVGSWKPDPGLFLHAAAAMGFQPSECAVIEDSVVGIEAAIAANMTAFHYQPDHDALTHVMATTFADMSQLADLLGVAVQDPDPSLKPQA